MVELVFTKDAGRFKAGMVKDYPKATWDQIAKSAGFRLNEFTKGIRDAYADSQKGQVKK